MLTWPNEEAARAAVMSCGSTGMATRPTVPPPPPPPPLPPLALALQEEAGQEQEAG